jgi:hypothetical protein
MRNKINLPYIAVNLSLIACGWAVTGTGFLLYSLLDETDYRLVATFIKFAGIMIVLLSAYRIYQATKDQ